MAFYKQKISKGAIYIGAWGAILVLFPLRDDNDLLKSSRKQNCL